MWPSQVCLSAREGIKETIVAVEVTETGATGGRHRLSTGNIRLTLGLVLSSCLVLGSCTIHSE